MQVCPYCHLLLGDAEAVCPHDGAKLEAAGELPPVPSALEAKLSAFEPFARGQTGACYLATQTQTGYRGLLKVIPLGRMDASERVRLKRELRKQTQLIHDGLPRIIDGGEIGDDLWMFREHLSGESLAQRIRRFGKLEVNDALVMTAQIASALDELQRNGLLHRDVKAGHIIVQDGPSSVGTAPALRSGASGLPIAKLIDAGLPGRLATGSVFDLLGTPAYISPEQVAGKLVSFRSDLYGLGCLLFEMLTGAPPFPGADVRAVLEAHKNTPAPTLSIELPAAVQSLLRALLSKEPRQRPFSAQQVRRTLEPLLPPGASLPALGARPMAAANAAAKAAAAAAPITEEIDLEEIGTVMHSVAPAKTVSLSAAEIEALEVREEPSLASPRAVHLSDDEFDALEVGDSSEEPSAERDDSATELYESLRDDVQRAIEHEPEPEVAAPTIAHAPTEAAATPAQASVGGDAPALRGGASVGGDAPALRGGASVGGDAPALRGGASVGGDAPALRGGASVGGDAPALRGGASVGGDAPALRGGASVRRAVDFDVESLFDDDVASEPGPERRSSLKDSAPTQLYRRPESAEPEPQPASALQTDENDALVEEPVDREGTVIAAVPKPRKPPVPKVVWFGALVAAAVLLIAVMLRGRSQSSPQNEASAAADSVAQQAQPNAEPSAPAPTAVAAEPAAAAPSGEAAANQPGNTAPADPGAMHAATAPSEPQAGEQPAPAAGTDAPAAAPSDSADQAAAAQPRAGAVIPANVAAAAGTTDVSRGAELTAANAAARSQPGSARLTQARGSRTDRLAKAEEYKAQGRTAYQAGHYRDAAAAYGKATEQNPSDAAAFAGMAASRLADGDAGGAVQGYSRAVRLQPSSSGFHAALGRAYLQQGDRGRARAAYEHALQLDATNGAAKTALAQLK